MCACHEEHLGDNRSQKPESDAGVGDYLAAEAKKWSQADVRCVQMATGLERQGQDSLQLSERCEEPIHLLLTDVVMPELSGRDVADQLTQLRPDMKLLYISGYTDDAIIRHRILDSDVPYLQKPFTGDALLDKVREVLDGSRLVGTSSGEKQCELS